MSVTFVSVTTNTRHIKGALAPHEMLQQRVVATKSQHDHTHEKAAEACCSDTSPLAHTSGRVATTLLVPAAFS